MVTQEETVLLHPTRDGRLLVYAVIGFGGLALALLTASPPLAAVALPFALALHLGLRRNAPVRVTARVDLDVDRVLEGDPVTGRLTLRWDGDFDARVRLHRLNGMALGPEGEDRWALPDARSRVELPLQLVATRWGLHRMADVWVRLERPHGLLTWTGKVLSGPRIRVLPGRETLSRLLDPADSRAVWGMHRSRNLGDGHEFAELRPYAPGDRLRDLNWAATARRGHPIVNRYHSDLAGDVVIAIDAFADGSESAQETLSRAARAAWTLASVHLRANDRVGIAGFGGSARWLAPDGGRRAQYQILETLLEIGGDAEIHATAARAAGRPAIPGSSLVIALTPLHDAKTLDILAEWRLRGRAVNVVVFESPLLKEGLERPSERLAARLWEVELEQRKRRLGRMGIPVITVPTGGSVNAAVATLRRTRRTSRAVVR